MRIGILCHTGAGGSGVLATELALGLSQLGHDVHIVGERPPFRMEQLPPSTPEGQIIYKDLGEAPPVKSFWGQLVQGVRRSFSGRFGVHKVASQNGKVHFHEFLSFNYPLFDSNSLPTLRAANTLAALIERFKIEVINAHYVIPHATSAILARDSGLGVKVVTTLHGTDVTRVGCDPAFSFTTKHAIQSSDEVTAVCRFLANEAVKNFSVIRPITVIPNWVDSKRFVRITDPKVKARYAQPEEFLCAHISNFRTIKRSIEAVRIFAKILEKVPCRLLLVGDGPDKQSCIDLAVSMGISGRVLSLPPTAAVENILGLSDLLFLPSETEAFPLVVLEAMAAGAVAIASNVGGLSEMIENGRNGFLYPPTDIESMAQKGVEILNNPELAAQIRVAARESVVERFAPEKLIAQYLAIYQKAIEAKDVEMVA